jgi:endonuclease/exonuclease/phosphatase family metal-dependent hydrolase
LLAAALFAVGCSDAPPVGPDAGDEVTMNAMRWHGSRVAPVKVFSRNLYIGFNVDETIGALASGDPEIIGPAIDHALNVLMATDFPTRAGAVADEIDRLRPDVVGLTEVSHITFDFNGDGELEVDLRFLDILQAKLAERGLKYEVAATVENSAVDLAGFGFPNSGLVDNDVILVSKKRVKVLDSGGAQYQYAQLGDPYGIGISILRGWNRIHAKIRGVELEIWNTHMEAGPGEPFASIRAGQALELVGMASSEMPVIVLGDLNDELGSDMYGVMTGAGFENVWETLWPMDDGFTCCHADDLSNATEQMYERIDHVFVRGLDADEGTILLTGLWPWERVPGPYGQPLWASDHAGVYAALPLH